VTPKPIEKERLNGVEWGIYYALIHENSNASVADPVTRWGMDPEEFAIVRKWLTARIAELHAKKP